MYVDFLGPENLPLSYLQFDWHRLNYPSKLRLSFGHLDNCAKFDLAFYLFLTSQ